MPMAGLRRRKRHLPAPNASFWPSFLESRLVSVSETEPRAQVNQTWTQYQGHEILRCPVQIPLHLWVSTASSYVALQCSLCCILWDGRPRAQEVTARAIVHSSPELYGSDSTSWVSRLLPRWTRRLDARPRPDRRRCATMSASLPFQIQDA